MFKTQFGKFLIKFLILLFILVISDILLGLLFDNLLKKQRDGRLFKILYSIDESREDIIIIGSSHAEQNFNPNVFSKELGMSCWNAGRGGQGLSYFLAIEHEILLRYSPEILIINIEPQILEGDIDLIRLSILRPFTKNHKSISELLAKTDYFEKYKLSSNIYRYNSMMFYFLRPYFFKNKDGSFSDRGWKPKNGIIPSSLIPPENKNINTDIYGKLNPDKVNFFIQLINLVNEKQTKLVLTFSPDFIPYSGETTSIRYIKNLSKTKGYVVFDFSRDSSFVKKQNYFYDLQHLNSTGANLFSKSLSDSILLIYKAPIH